MATKLNKTIKRELQFTGDWKGNPYMVEVKQGDVLEFRVKGKRRRIEIPLAQCVQLAEIWDAEHKYKEALNLYNAKKALGQRAKRPRKAEFPYNDVYFKALSNVKTRR